jgi:hypothetical protein
MTVSTDDLRKLVGTTTADNAVLDQCLKFALELVTRHALKAEAPIPTAVLDEAHLAVAADQFNRRKTPNGILNQQFETANGGGGVTAVRIGRDPLSAAYSIMAPWMPAVSFA